MTQTPSVLTNTVVSAAGQLLARVLALVFYGALQRAFGPELYSEQAEGAAWGTLFVVLLEPGLNALMVRDAAHNRPLLQERLRTLLGYKLLALLVVWPGSVAFTHAVMGYQGRALWAVVFAGGTILWGALEDTAAAALVALEQLKAETRLRLLSKTCLVTLGLAAVFTHQSFEAVLASVCAGAALGGLAGLFLLRRAGLRVGLSLDVAAMARCLAAGWPLALHNVMWMLTLRLDQVLAQALGASPEALGKYGAAVKLFEALLLFPSAVGTAFQARLATQYTLDPKACARELQLGLAASFAVCIPLAMGGAFLAEPLGTLVGGERFSGMGILLSVQVWCLPLVGLQGLGSYALQAAGHVKQQALSSLVNLVVNVAANVVLVPRWGMVGASLGAVAGGVAATLVYAWALRRVGLNAGWMGALWRPCVASAGMAAALALLTPRGLPVLVTVAAGGLVYAVLFVLVGGKGVVVAMQGARRHTGGSS